jgi:hypothetical protein
MRAIIVLVMLSLAGCSVDNDPANDQVTVKYDEAKIKKSAATAGRTAKEVGSGIANVANDTGKAIKREVGDVDVDVKVSRKPTDPKQPATQSTP